MRHYLAYSWVSNARPVSNFSLKCACGKNPRVGRTRVCMGVLLLHFVGLLKS